MESLTVGEDGSIPLPLKYQDCRHLIITTPYSKRVISGRSETWYFRHKSLGNKPYLEEGFLTIKEAGKPEDRYRVLDKDGKLAIFGEEVK